jgi:hypothetical protein
MRLQLALVSAVALSGCVAPAPREPVTQIVPPGNIPTGAAPIGRGRHIIFNGTGGFVLPDGSTVAADAAGGFTLPNGSYAAPDGAGGLTLPNGSRCISDGARGYLCP